MRLFIALDIGEEQKKKAAAMIARLAGYISGARWVNESAMHLTLKFIGETSFGEVEIIKAAMRDALQDFRPFELALSGPGVFPSPRKTRVIWLGINPGAEIIAAIAGALDRELAAVGFEPEKRKYRPHLTLGRLRSLAPEAEIRRFLAEERNFYTDPVLVKGAVLYQSELTRERAIYTPLHRQLFWK